MTVMECDKLTNQEQIRVLKSLGQQAAAYLAGCSARALRDHYIQRNDDGTYDSKKVLEWARERVTTEQVSDDLLEQILILGERWSFETYRPLVRLVDDLIAEYGEQGYAVLGKALATEWRDHCEADDDGIPPLSQAERQRMSESAVEQENRQRASLGLRIKIECESCGRIRNGRYWVRGVVPDGWTSLGGKCPKCRGQQKTCIDGEW